MTIRSDVPAFVDLAPFSLDALREEPSTIYALSQDLRITYVNAAWTRFALANGARWNEGEWGIGRSVMDAIPELLRPFYERLFERALEERVVVEHDYDCSSATVSRRFRMRLLPCEAGGLLVVHSLLREDPRSEPGMPPLDALYRHLGMIAQCSHCRRVQRANEPDHWDWVPAYVEQPQPNTSHGLCPLCADYYYSEARLDA